MRGILAFFVAPEKEIFDILRNIIEKENDIL